MSIAIVTGATGLVGMHAVEQMHELGLDIVGIDNDMRCRYFPRAASADPLRDRLLSLPRYRHIDQDIRDEAALNAVFQHYGRDISVVVHTAAQPSHDWAAEQPLTDFAVNATGTLLLLEATRNSSPDAPFVHCSTNKVYGSRPNDLPLVETETRWEIADDHPFRRHGISEGMSIDASMRSLFGVSKTAADLMVQEYGLYFGMKTAVFRAGCITGATHRGVAQHGFLAHLSACVALGRRYDVIGHSGKQVRDNLHASDLVRAFVEYVRDPRPAAIYNMGGGRSRSCSVLEAITFFEAAYGRSLEQRYVPEARRGDHVWWITDTRRFEHEHPGWKPLHSLEDMVLESVAEHRSR